MYVVNIILLAIISAIVIGIIIGRRASLTNHHVRFWESFARKPQGSCENPRWSIDQTWGPAKQVEIWLKI